MQCGFMGRLADMGLRLGAGTPTQHHVPEIGPTAGKGKPHDARRGKFMLTSRQQNASGPALSRAVKGGPAACCGGVPNSASHAAACRGRGGDRQGPSWRPKPQKKRAPRPDVSETWFFGMRKVDRSARMIERAFSADEFRPTAQR